MAVSVLESRRLAERRIFESVFPPNPAASVPTATATPAASFRHPAPPTASTHGYNTRHHPSPAQSSGSSTVSLLPSPADVLARETRAWHIATSFLSFQDSCFPDSAAAWIAKHASPPRDAREAIKYLILNNEDGYTEGKETLIEWYVCEVRRHFLGWVKPEIEIPASYGNAEEVLQGILKRLITAQTIYLYQLKHHLLLSHVDASPRKGARKGQRRRGKKPLAEPDETDNDDPRVRSFLRSLNSMISYSLPDPKWSDLVYTVFLELCGVAVGLPVEGVEDDGEETVMDETSSTASAGSAEDAVYDNLPQSFSTVTDGDGDIVVTTDDGEIIVPEEMDGISDFEDFKRRPRGPRAEARRRVLELWEAMERIGVGGGGRRGERIFAEVINTLITTYIHKSFARVWTSPSRVGVELAEWVQGVLGVLIVDVLFSARDKARGKGRTSKLSPRESLRASRQSLDKIRRGGMELDDGPGADEEELKRRKEDLDNWKQIAVGRLGRLRVSELFDIVVEWPDSLGGAEDLKSYITTPQTRLHLSNTFTASLANRLLHPAAATSDILRAYVKLIRAFAVLDPRGVLLERVSRGIRRYLRDRDDTVRVIVRGVMSDSVDSSQDSDDLSELSGELSKGIPALAITSGGLEELDYDDMSWVPDPVDAGPEFRRSKGLDVVGSLFSLWESKEVWVKEIQNVLSARLLQESTYDFRSEIKTVELLKLRFGEAAVQSCDVMLKDMADSKRAAAIIKDMFRTRGLNADEEPVLEAKILSRLFWPAAKEESFRLPPEVQRLLDAYTQGFEGLKKKRKIDWMLTLGTVDVELELEDRIVSVPDATAAQAAVIHAFDSVASLTFDELAHTLEMEPKLLRSVVAFWIEKDVLREEPHGVFHVLETLEEGAHPGAEMAAVAGQPDEEETISEEKLQERRVVQQYVVGMLTNGGAMPTERIAMMLGMLVAGFSWGLDELATFLAGLKEAGIVDLVNGAWKVP